MKYIRNNVICNYNKGSLIVAENDSITYIEGFIAEVWNYCEKEKSIEEILSYCNDIFEEIPENFEEILCNELKIGVENKFFIVIGE